MKKLLAILLALTMILSLAITASAEAEDVVSYSDIFDTENDLETMEITLASISVTEGFDYTNGNDFFSYWSDKFKVEWDLISLSWDTWNTQLNTWISAEDMPDWCIWNFDVVTANEWVDQELIRQWPEDWREKYPHLAAAADACEYNQYFEEVYGGMYIFFKPLYFSNFPADFLTNSTSVFIRKDWADQIGYDLSSNIESGTIKLSELFDYASAIKEAGILEYPIDMSATNVMYLMGFTTEGNGVSTSAYTNFGSDEYYWGPEKNAEEIKTYLGMIKDAYDEGLINPEFFASGNDESFNNSGKSCMALISGDPGSISGQETKFRENQDLNMADVTAAFVLTDENGVSHEEIRDNYWSCNILSPNLSDEEVERILAIWDYCCRDDVQIPLHMGFEGIDWEYNEAGLAVSLLGDTEYGDIYTKYKTLYPLYNMVALQGDDFMFIDASLTDYSREVATKLFQTRANTTIARQKVKDYDLISYSSPHASTSGIVYADEYAHLITMDGDLSENYDEFIRQNRDKANLIVQDMNEYKNSLK